MMINKNTQNMCNKLREKRTIKNNEFQFVALISFYYNE